MNLYTIERALESLQKQKNEGLFDDIDEADLANCFIELTEMKCAAPDTDYYKDVTILPSLLMLDFGNKMWYDTYGRMARRLPNGRDIPGNFINAVRQEDYCTEVSSMILEDVYYFLHDLWQDNEDCGSNNPDGTYCDSWPTFSNDMCNKQTHCDAIDCIEPDAIAANELLQYINNEMIKANVDYNDEAMKQFYDIKLTFSFNNKTVTFNNGAAVFTAMQNAMEYIVSQQ